MAASTTPSNRKKGMSPSTNRYAASSAALEAVGARPRRVQRRPTKLASYELCNHAKAYLESGHYASGYDFLYSLLAAGTSISTPAQPYIGLLAPSAYIGLAASLIAYPKTTTRTNSRAAKKGADAAIRYLRCVHTTIDGPAYPAIRKAFSLPEANSRRRAPAHRATVGSQSPEDGGNIEHLAGAAANGESLWGKAEDFWHIVGWALNCSVAHKKRWDRWKLWLDTILDFLEADWDLCVQQSKHYEDGRGDAQRESLIWHYIASNSEISRGGRRRIVKALLATATPESLKHYPEIWDKETVGPKQEKVQDKPLGEVDFETGEMADYDSDEDMPDAAQANEGAASEGLLSSNVDNGPARNISDAVERLGGMDAVELRQRFIALLAQVAQALPNEFTTLSDFFDNILEELIQLPTITLQILLSTSKMPGLSQMAFNANLLLPLASGTLPDYFNNPPIQQHFEKTLLPLRGTAQSFAANAKISLLLEQMVLYMMSENALISSDALVTAFVTGIDARHGVCGTARGKRGTAEDETQAKAIMEACSERLLGLLELIEMAAGKSPQAPLDKTAPGFVSFGSGSSLSSPPETPPDAQSDGDA